MPSEADIREVLQELIDASHALYLPRFLKNGFEFRRCTGLRTLVSGMYGLLEPPADAQPLDRSTVNYALIPGVAFDRQGNRLGRGNGGFDRWIADVRKENPKAHLWGIALEYQIVHSVPVEPHDQPMDAIITAREMIIA
jgi:5-formyltetrahydrofolate cyclo-ligase